MKQECIDNKVLKLVADDVYAKTIENTELKEMVMDAVECENGQKAVLYLIRETLLAALVNITPDLKDEDYIQESKRILNKLKEKKEEGN